MELCRDDFKTVLIGEGGWGPIDKDVAEKHTGLFECGHCTTPQHKVFHNVLGAHLHITEKELTQRVDAAMWNLDQ